MVRRTLTTLLIAFAYLLAPAAAQADDFPLPGYTTLGEGQRPDAAIDGGGNIHIVWTRDTSSGSVLEYCKLSATTISGCVLRKTFDTLGGLGFESLGPAFVFVDGRAGGDDIIIVLSVSAGARNSTLSPTYALRSPDGGANFADQVISNNFRIGSDAAFARPGASKGTILALGRDLREAAGKNPGNSYQAMPLSGPPDSRQIVLENGKFGAGTTVAPSAGPTPSSSAPLVVYDRNVEGLLLRGVGGESSYALASWPRAEIPFGYGSRLAGTDEAKPPFLITGDQDERLTVRRDAGGAGASSPGSFGPPTKLSDYSSGQQAIAQDAPFDTANVFAAWRVESEGQDALAYSLSADSGKTFAQPVFLAGGEDELRHIEIAARGSGSTVQGAVVFGEQFTGAINGPVGLVRLPATATGQGAASAARAGAAKTKRTRYARRTEKTLGKGGTVVALAAPVGCVKQGSRLPVRTYVSDKRFKLRKRRTRVTRMEFSLGGSEKADTSAPFGADLSTSGLSSRSKESVRADIFTRRNGRTERVAGASFRVKVCK